MNQTTLPQAWRCLQAVHVFAQFPDVLAVAAIHLDGRFDEDVLSRWEQRIDECRADVSTLDVPLGDNRHEQQWPR